MTWRNRQVGSVRAAFLGTVSAESGAAHVYLQPGADALAETWSGLTGGVVEPASAIPEPVLRAAAYPGRPVSVQAQALEQAPWKAGSLGAGTRPTSEPPLPQVGWAADTSGPLADLRLRVHGGAAAQRHSGRLPRGRTKPSQLLPA